MSAEELCERAATALLNMRAGLVPAAEADPDNRPVLMSLWLGAAALRLLTHEQRMDLMAVASEHLEV